MIDCRLQIPQDVRLHGVWSGSQTFDFWVSVLSWWFRLPVTRAKARQDKQGTKEGKILVT